jgi:PAS domain S-box-containing protein
MHLFHNFSISRRLMLISLLTTVSALLLSSVVLVTNEVTAFRRSLVQGLAVQARIIGGNSASALLFNDQKSAEETLSALNASPHIDFAVIYSKSGMAFATYRRGGADKVLMPSLPTTEGHRFSIGHLSLYQRIVLNNKTIGSIYIQSDLNELYSRLMWYALTLFGVTIASSVVALLIFSRLQKSITNPLLNLVGLMRTISKDKDYSVRAEIGRRDEIGLLSEGFNTMLTQIQMRDKDLELQQKGLEYMVAERTANLVKTKEQLEQELSERKKTEEALRTSREFIKNILDTVDEAFIVIDADYRIILANRAYCRQTGMSVEDIMGKHCYNVSHRINKPCYEAGEECAVHESFQKGEPSACVHKHYYKASNVVYVETKSYPVKDPSGNVTSVIEIVNNITDKQLLEEQLLRTQKLEAVGLLAGGIAHDFNNLLQGVFGSISVAKIYSGKEGKAYEMLEEAERALNQSRNLTKQLLTFSKGGEPVKRAIALSPVIHNSVKFALSGSRVNYTFSIDDHLWPVEADEGQINQVIHNIVINAGDSMPDGGNVRIEAQNVLIDKESGLPLKKGKYVRIVIADSGTGIPDDHISRIFDPYFTTKLKGSGLGLTTSYSIIKKHGGLLDVKSQVGVGSTLSIYLPASEEKPLQRKEQEIDLLTGKGRILVMDDEEIVRRVAGHMIKSLGYEVDFAADGEQAVEKYSAAMKSGKLFDAVILDLTVRGGMGGGEAMRKLVAIDAAVRAIVSSGYSGDSILSDYRNYGFKAVLSKPYEIEELSRTLYAVVRT